MPAASKISDFDRGYTARLRAIRSMDGKVTARVGVFGDKAKKQHDEESGLTNGELASIHEFGAGNVPSRSFVRGWVDENEQKARDRLKEHAVDVLQLKYDIYAGMHRFGQWSDLEILKRITAHIAPPLFLETVLRKGNDTPLVDTGELIGAIDSAVERNRKVIK